MNEELIDELIDIANRITTILAESPVSTERRKELRDLIARAFEVLDIVCPNHPRTRELQAEFEELLKE